MRRRLKLERLREHVVQTVDLDGCSLSIRRLKLEVHCHACFDSSSYNIPLYIIITSPLLLSSDFSPLHSRISTIRSSLKLLLTFAQFLLLCWRTRSSLSSSSCCRRLGRFASETRDETCDGIFTTEEEGYDELRVEEEDGIEWNLEENGEAAVISVDHWTSRGMTIYVLPHTTTKISSKLKPSQHVPSK